MTKRLSLFLVLLLSVLTLGHIGSSVTLAAEIDGTQTVTLHKVRFGFGEELPEDLSDLDPLAEVEFEVYDVTEDLHNMLAEGSSHEEAYDTLTTRGITDAKMFATGVTNREGLLNFNLPYSLDENKAYLFHESVIPNGIRERSPDFIIITPLVDENDNILEVAHIYPKNESLEELDIDKIIDSEGVSFDIGENIPYELRTKVPVYPSDFEQFIIRDTADDVLIFNPDSLQVEIGGEVVGGIYEYDPNEHGFELTFDVKALEAFRDEEMLITYNMYLSEEAIPDTNYYNQGELDYGHLPTIVSTIVRTGGYRFEKVDRIDADIKLAGARFIIRDEENRYLSNNNDRYSWQENSDNAAEFVSMTDGSIEVFGLKYGQYYLEEIEAPAGYVLSDTAIPFRIAYQTYLSGPVLPIINEIRPQLPITGGEEPPVKPQLPITRGEEPPVRPRLPITGEASNIILGVVGIVFIGTAVVILYKQFTSRRKENEEAN